MHKGEMTGVEELKIYISAFVLTVLATIKMAFPAAADQLREMTLDLLSSDKNCIEVIETMGKKISESGITRELIEVFGFNREHGQETANMNDKTEPEGKTETVQRDESVSRPES